MFDGYRIVSVCPAGRRRYVELLAEYLLRERGLIDEHEWWVNTSVRADVRFLRKLCQRHRSFFRFVRLSSHLPHPARGAIPRFAENDRRRSILRIAEFFPRCTDPKTIYVRLDDDIVYVAPGAIRSLLEFRVANPEPFLVYPSIVNGACLSSLHQSQGAFGVECGVCTFEPGGLGLKSGSFAELVHRSFLRALGQGDTTRWRFESMRLDGYPRVHVNCIAWFGRDMLPFGGAVRGDEEYFLTKIKPAELGRPSVVWGQALVVHFGYHPQRSHLDATDLLERYWDVCRQGDS